MSGKAASAPDRGNSDLIASGDDAAFVTGVLAAAAITWRSHGQFLIKHAKRMPRVRSGIKSELRAARRSMQEQGQALVSAADALDHALRMPASSRIATLNADKMQEAIQCFGQYVAAQERGAAVFQSIIGAALAGTPVAGHA